MLMRQKRKVKIHTSIINIKANYVTRKKKTSLHKRKKKESKERQSHMKYLVPLKGVKKKETKQYQKTPKKYHSVWSLTPK